MAVISSIVEGLERRGRHNVITPEILRKLVEGLR